MNELFSQVITIKTNRMRQLKKAIKMCKGQMFKTCDMNSKDYSVWVLFGVLNNTMHVLKVEKREPYKPKLYGTNVKNIIFDEIHAYKGVMQE